jgi:hypothetical protein
MTSRNVLRGVDVLTADDELNVVTLERLERRLGEECGELRLEISTLRGEMIDRSGELLKWLLAFFVGQTAALGALMAIFR